MMCVELELQSGGEKVTKEALTKVFTDLGAQPEKFAPVLEKRASGADEKILVTAGDQATCEKVRDKFIEIGMKAEVRALTEEDVPSEYDGSDVIPAGNAKLASLLENANGSGVLVAFTAPWCKHCHTLAPELKEAATQLKDQGVKVAAVNTQHSPKLAQGLGVKMLPTIMWLQPTDDGRTAAAEYQGERKAAALVRFAQVAGQSIKEQMAAAGAGAGGAAQAQAEASKAATEASDVKAAGGSKIGMSKMGKSKAAGPDAGGESKLGESKAKASEVQEGAAAAEGVAKAAAPA